MNIKNEVCQLNQELIRLRRDLHQYPELGREEFRTADKVSAYLHDVGLKVQRVSETGVMAVLKGANPGKTLMLRAEMDALPIEEKTGASYASTCEGKMHACGHDGHVAMLLVAAKVLARHRAHFRGAVKFLFQPDEENMFADRLVEKGILGDPRVDAACGIHLMTALKSGKIGISAGAVMAGMHAFRLQIQGKGGHTGFPQESVDPILTATDVVQRAQLIQSRKIDVLKPTSIVFGKI